MNTDHPASFDLAACQAHLRARHERIFQEREQTRQTILSGLRRSVCLIVPRFPGIRRVYLFGSLLRPGAPRLDSDVDIAIEGTLCARDYFALWRCLEDASEGWPVDLVDLDSSLHFASRVRETGELIYGRSDSDAEGGHLG